MGKCLSEGRVADSCLQASHPFKAGGLLGDGGGATSWPAILPVFSLSLRDKLLLIFGGEHQIRGRTAFQKKLFKRQHGTFCTF